MEFIQKILYVGALFRLIGFSYITSYRLFLLFINALTILIAYYSFLKIFEDRYIGFCVQYFILCRYIVFPRRLSVDHWGRPSEYSSCR